MSEEKFAVIGDPVAHSLSPSMFTHVFKEISYPGTYEAIQVSAKNFPEEIKKIIDKDFRALNVTLPLKTLAFNWSTLKSTEALSAKAANCLLLGEKSSHNSDIYGAALSLKELPELKSYILLGTGGAAKGVLETKSLKGKKGYLVSRSKEKAENFISNLNSNEDISPLSYDQIAQISEIETSVLINSTPLGLKSEEYPDAVLDALKVSRGLFDLVYKKTGTTKLCEFAKDLKKPYVDGRLMLAAQAKEAFEFFTGEDIDLKIFTEALAKSLAEKA